MPRSFEKEFGVGPDGWTSSVRPVQRLLDHLARRMKSWSSRDRYLEILQGFVRFAGAGPERLVTLTTEEASELVQSYADHLARRGCGLRTVNGYANTLITFFKVNGYRKGRELEVEKHHVPARYRKRNEYIPSKEEAWSMANSWGRNLAGLRNRAITLALLSSGLRNGTLRALLCGDLKEELESGREWAIVHVRPEMKQTVRGACKGDIPYYAFLFPESAQAIREWLLARALKFGPISDRDPVFCPMNGSTPKETKLSALTISRQELQSIVKGGAKRAGIKQWKDVHPHCLRKTFEFVLRDTRRDGSRMDVKTQEFFMGHILPGVQDRYYDSTKIEWMRREFSKLNFEVEAKDVKELRDQLRRKDEEMENLARRQEQFERTVLEALVVGRIPSLTLDVFERAGYEVMKNPDGSYTLKK